MQLDAGVQILRITILDKPLFNLDYLEVTRDITSAPISNEENDQFSIFQSKEEIIIRNVGKETVQLKLFSITGTEIKTIHQPSSNFSISKQGLHRGIFIVQLISPKQKISKKIILQ